jgi:hypothetical protein
VSVNGPNVNLFQPKTPSFTLPRWRSRAALAPLAQQTLFQFAELLHALHNNAIRIRRSVTHGQMIVLLSFVYHVILFQENPFFICTLQKQAEQQQTHSFRRCSSRICAKLHPVATFRRSSATSTPSTGSDVGAICFLTRSTAISRNSENHNYALLVVNEPSVSISAAFPCSAKEVIRRFQIGKI